MFRRRSLTLIFAADQDTVARPNEILVQEHRETCLLADLDAGVDRMRWRGQVWLPKEHLEEHAQYNIRVARSDLYPGLSSALDEVGAQPFGRPVQCEGLPPQLESFIKNVDGDGNDLTQFAKALMRSACKYGRAHVLADYTQVQASNGSTPSRADAEKAGQRAFWKIIEKPQLLGWRSMTLPSGEPAFREIRIHELRTVPDGTWGEKKAEFVRVIRKDSYELWQNLAYDPALRSASLDEAVARNYEPQFYDVSENRRQDWKLVESGPFGNGFGSVPLVTVYTGYCGFMRVRSPFAKLAETNLTHWQSSSDQRNIIHIARVPILFGRGFRAEEYKGGVPVGAGTAFFSESPSAALTIVEHSGAAVSVGQEDLDQLERRMEQMGVRPHIERSSGASATGVFQNADGAATDIQAWAQATDTGLEQCFEWTAKWMGVPLPQDFDVQIFKDYAVKLNGGQDVQSLLAMFEKGLIDAETALKEVKRRGLLGDDIDIEKLIANAEAEKARKAEVAAQIAGGISGKPNTQPGEGGKPKPGAEDEDTDDSDDTGGMPMPPNHAGRED